MMKEMRKEKNRVVGSCRHCRKVLNSYDKYLEAQCASEYDSNEQIIDIFCSNRCVSKFIVDSLFV